MMMRIDFCLLTGLLLLAPIICSASSTEDSEETVDPHTGAFEQTNRLRKANSVQSNPNSRETDERAAEPGAVLSAEAVDQESVEILANDRLKKRDTFAAIHANQSWSPFPNASRIEGSAIATEKRMAELRKRLDSANKLTPDQSPIQSGPTSNHK